MTYATDVYLGIDGGGTKCKARLEDAQGNLLAEAIAGPANAARNLTGSVKAVLEASEKAIAKANIKGLTLNQIHAGIGLAGINIPQVKQAFLKQSLPFASWHITTDLHIACLGAHLGQDGAIVIVGTGSSGVAIHNDQQFEMGGHGFVVGDKGSGAWLGKMAISHCLETLDGITPNNLLSKQVINLLDCDSAYDLVNLTLEAKPVLFASVAPLIFQLAANQQEDALLLVNQAATYINKICHRLLSGNLHRLSLIGGITQPLTPYLDSQLQAIIRPAQATPEQGAILYSKIKLAGSVLL
ncbi:BadF/BadG/BcrA/BcrD ATPase family protein [uncultured Paraglaciecola sp.]|uniref:BadF/BadG/BcrA/BcrD ATPase family protein n=1 Tax=uncultured Paraglaciecola sp. TaxID=1765024 RepID=UPI002625B9FE|nr:BadF/BadG/BcrA/BcrD ATPase family protein [uncultured Paraglaciecola sp.]